MPGGGHACVGRCRSRVPSAASDGIGQAFHVAQRVGGLAGPAPLARRARRRSRPGVRAATWALHSACPATLADRCHRAPRRRGRRCRRRTGRTPAASMASLPALAVHGDQRVACPAEAEWTQASFPATRNPVSSKWRDFSGGDRRADRLQRRAQRPGDPGDHAGDRARGDRDAEQLRPSPGRSGPGTGTGRATGTRRSPTAAGPYRTGAVTPAGARARRSPSRSAHRREII